MNLVDNYKPRNYSNSGFGSLANVLTQAGIKDPDGNPWTDALLLGISGGLGCMYILWEFKSHQTATLTLGFNYRCNYSKEYLGQAAQRAGAAFDFLETGGSKKAQTNLDNSIDQGQVPLSWLDPYFLPYRYLPGHLEGCGGVTLPICGRDAEGYTVHDGGLFALSGAQLVSARARVGSYKNRLMVVKPGEPWPWKDAISAGIRDGVRYLSSGSKSFGIPALEKWAKHLTDTKNSKAWRKVFATGNGLYSSLKAIYVGVEHDGAGGYRSLYVDFLKQVAKHFPNAGQAMTAYRQAAQAWTTFANHAVAPFPDTRALLDQRQALLNKGDASGLATVNREIERLRSERDPHFTEPAGLFELLQKDLEHVIDCEKKGLAALQKIEVSF